MNRRKGSDDKSDSNTPTNWNGPHSAILSAQTKKRADRTGTAVGLAAVNRIDVSCSAHSLPILKVYMESIGEVVVLIDTGACVTTVRRDVVEHLLVDLRKPENSLIRVVSRLSLSV